MPREHVKVESGHQIGVGWDKNSPQDRAVQVGLEGFNPFTFVSNPDSRYTSLWVELSRKDINELIRRLRTARDRAYGRDE